MKRLSNIFVSAVFLVDEQGSGIATTTKTLAATMKDRYANYEIIVVDNGLIHTELKELKELLPKIACIRIVRLSRTYDTDTAIFAGIEASIGDFICTLYNNDPISLLPGFVDKAQEHDIVFGVATNLQRTNFIEEAGAKLFYWYSKKSLHINIPNGSTYFICMNRSAANALTRSGRFTRHIRHMAKQVGFKGVNFKYELPPESRLYTKVRSGTLISRAIELISSNSSHPLRVLSYFGILAGLVNVLYAGYVVAVNLSQHDIEKGWTTLSLQSSVMFFILFMILAVLAEYIGKILSETQHEPPYHIMQELSSTVSIADETRRNVTK